VNLTQVRGSERKAKDETVPSIERPQIGGV
jgi:hypothetical protein